MPAESVKVVIAEDDPAIRDLIQTHLRLAGYATFMAHNGREALERVWEVEPQVMLLDINMPVLDGFGVLAEMRKARAGAKTAVMMLTARNSSDDVRQAISLGAKDFLRKPFTQAQLLARMGRLSRPARPSHVL